MFFNRKSISVPKTGSVFCYCIFFLVCFAAKNWTPPPPPRWVGKLCLLRNLSFKGLK